MTERNRVLSTRTIAWWGTGIVLLAAVAAALLLWLLGGGTPADSSRLDALRTASSIVVGTGGAAALLLAARRQRSAELDLEQKDHDATQRRITDMYGKAADQLGSDKAPVRLAGLYALERLAQSHADQRQTIVNVLCAYLRMPLDGTDEEVQVRKAAQRILMLHLRPGGGEEPNGSYWPDIDLDFSGARLIALTLTHCKIRSIVCYQTKFEEFATFRGTEFRTKADFHEAVFRERADFRGAVLGGDRDVFRGAQFEKHAEFGVHSEAGLAGALAKPGYKRSWPPGWTEEPGDDGWLRLVPSGVPE
ncbi:MULTISPECIES: pentapeptide repeat-containing protein [Amycolatopsis]|uniref:Pentapeptide repeat-containing protein n=1 Tax=Amycolatopsis dendrobii TaxID=2760662 RepID=A0A7W3Z8U1_9PSEU|nr:MULTISPECIES: pentapeptide repeat-containing protein [Amycolatopsis]MBB1152741.1 pentapeptide repeat-containing protein [Amycolatopsis dendrobii]UKD52082.1 pentapeptide repeat-containing protein [Amycolatopsis sp. FU40]